MSTNKPDPTNPNPTEIKTHKRWSRINYYNLDQWDEQIDPIEAIKLTGPQAS